MFDWITSIEAWIALATLIGLEVVLGVDNLIFISILSAKLPKEQQSRAQKAGLFFALFGRIALLSSLTWLIGLTNPIFSILEHGVSGRDVILGLGGLFLLYKATKEIHEKLEGQQGEVSGAIPATFSAVIAQIVIVDLVFSLDSVLTAVGMADDLAVMIIAVLVAVAVMMFFVGPLGRFVEEHPTVQMLALAFLILIGTTLMGEAMHFHIPKNYVYFAMAFSVGVEMLNLRLKAKTRSHPVELRKRYTDN